MNEYSTHTNVTKAPIAYAYVVKRCSRSCLIREILRKLLNLRNKGAEYFHNQSVNNGSCAADSTKERSVLNVLHVA